MKAQDYEASSKGISRDMSPPAIAERLRIVGELHDLARLLSTARFLGKVDPRSSRPTDPDGGESSGGGSGQEPTGGGRG